MKLLSKQFAENYDFKKMFETGGKIKNLWVASAYADKETIDNLYKIFKENINGTGAVFSVFLDKSASHAIEGQPLHEKYMDVTIKIRNLIRRNTLRQNVDESGIFLVDLGCLFHTKLVFMETTQKTIFIIGSMNMTVNGTAEDGNEELVIIKDANQKECVAIEDYFDKIRESSHEIKDARIKKSYVSLREFFLSGTLYSEVSRSGNFYFPMNFPQELYDKNIHIDDLINSDPRSRLNVLGLCDRLLLADKESAEENKKWKTYCLATDYGFWCPGVFAEKVSEILDNKAARRQSALEARLLQLPFPEFNERAVHYFKTISGRLADLGISWKVEEERWNSWLRALIRRLFEKVDGKYVIRQEMLRILLTGVCEAAVPDFWYDRQIFNPFEESFLESIGNEYAKKSQNKLAQALTNKFTYDISDINDLKQAVANDIDFSTFLK